MRIAHVSPYDHRVAGGVREHVVNLAAQHRALGHDARIVAPFSGGGDPGPGVVVASRLVLGLPGAQSIARVSVSPLAFATVGRILDRGRFDVVHVHEPLVPMVSLSALWHAGTVTVGTIHGYRPRYVLYEWFEGPLRRMMERLDARVAVSDDAAAWVSHYFPGEYHIVPDGVDVERFAAADLAPVDRYDDDRPTVLFVGRLDKRKGLDVLLDAFVAVRRARPGARLVVVGHYGPRERARAEREIAARGLDDVDLVGYVDDADLPRYYRTADVFCAPSTGFEALGIVLLEAMAAGTPVVTTDIPGYRTVVRDGRDGVLVPPSDAGRLADALVDLLDDPTRRKELGEEGRRRAQDYAWPTIARRLVDLYQRCGA